MTADALITEPLTTRQAVRNAFAKVGISLISTHDFCHSRYVQLPGERVMRVDQWKWRLVPRVALFRDRLDLSHIRDPWMRGANAALAAKLAFWRADLPWDESRVRQDRRDRTKLSAAIEAADRGVGSKLAAAIGGADDQRGVDWADVAAAFDDASRGFAVATRSSLKRRACERMLEDARGRKMTADRADTQRRARDLGLEIGL